MEVDKDQDETNSAAGNCKDQDLKETRPDGVSTNPLHETMGLSSSPSSKTPPCVLTGRGVTLSTLLTEGIIEAGNKSLSIDYLGRSFIADLLPSGRIKTPATGEEFATPSAWAMHCKQIVNPAKKSGCGWASVKYRGRKLDYYKNQWFRKQTLSRTMSPPVSETANTTDTENSGDETDKLPGGGNGERVRTGSGASSLSDLKKKTATVSDVQDEALNLCLHDDTSSCKKEAKGYKTPSSTSGRVVNCVSYSTLGKRSLQHDMSSLVETLTFASISKSQPFTASINTNSLLVLDFHAHLTTSEVCGYLAGRFDVATQHLSVLQAFPCRCNLDDKDNAATVENEIKERMRARGLRLVGWYHSHPGFSAQPSLRDIDSQMEHQYQLTSSDNSYSPCFAFIVSPYMKESLAKEAPSQAFMVFPPPEHRSSDYAMPMQVNYSVHQDTFLTQDVLTEMKDLVVHYSSSPDIVKFTSTWQRCWTYLDTIKSSLSKKLPKTQSENAGVLQIVHMLLAS